INFRPNGHASTARLSAETVGTQRRSAAQPQPKPSSGPSGHLLPEGEGHACRMSLSLRRGSQVYRSPSPSGRGCREAAGEGSKNFVEKTRSNILVTQRGIAAPTSELLSSRG